jgi:hypothetical protein
MKGTPREEGLWREMFGSLDVRLWSLVLGLWSLNFGLLWSGDFDTTKFRNEILPRPKTQDQSPKSNPYLSSFRFPPNASARWNAAQTAFESTVRRLPFSIW